MISTVYKLRNREGLYFQVPTSFARLGLRHSYSRLFFQTVQSLHIFKVNIPLQILFFLFLTLACSTTAVCQQKVRSKWISTSSPASSTAWHRFSLGSCVSVSYPPPSKLLIRSPAFIQQNWTYKFMLKITCSVTCFFHSVEITETWKTMS